MSTSVVSVAVKYDKPLKLSSFFVFVLKVNRIFHFVSVSDFPSRATCFVLDDALCIWQQVKIEALHIAEAVTDQIHAAYASSVNRDAAHNDLV